MAGFCAFIVADYVLADVGFGALSLFSFFPQAKPDAGKLVIATVALLLASTSSILIVSSSHFIWCIGFSSSDALLILLLSCSRNSAGE